MQCGSPCPTNAISVISPHLIISLSSILASSPSLMNRLLRLVLCLGSLRSCQGVRTAGQTWRSLFGQQPREENIEMDNLNPVENGVIKWIDPEDSEVKQNVTENTIFCELRTQNNMAVFLDIDRRTGKKRIARIVCPITGFGTVSPENAVEYVPETLNSDPQDYQVLVLQYLINQAGSPPITDDNERAACFNVFHNIFAFYAERVPIMIPHEPNEAEDMDEVLQMDELTPATASIGPQSPATVREPVAPLNRLNREICRNIKDAKALPEELEKGTYSEGWWRIRQVFDPKNERLKCTIVKRLRWIGSQTRDVDIIIAEGVMRISANLGGKREPVRLNDALLAKLRSYVVLSKDEGAPSRCEVFIKGMHRHITKDETPTDTPTHTDTQYSPVYSDTTSSSTDSQGSSSYADSLKAVFDYIMEHVPRSPE